MLQRNAGIAILLSGLLIAAPAMSQSNATGELNVDMARCIALETEAQRLACYQTQVESALAERSQPASAAPNASVDSAPPAPTAAVAAPAAPTAQPQPSATPAQSQSTPAAASVPQNNSDSIFGFEAGREFHGTITKLREQAPDRYVITLDNGQVWQMNQAKRYPLSVGQQVRVVSTRWGPSFRLTAIEHGGFVQVRRAL